MALKSFKPTTPGQRQLVIVDRSELWKGRPVKALTQGKREQGGRNNLGRITHNVEMKPGKGGQLARAAGTFVQLVGRDAGYALLRLSSGEVRMVRAECRATIGAVSNPDRQNIVIGKAGRNRWLGKKPSVRGVAMNPIDHPHGGGEGRTSGRRHPGTPWGKGTKGTQTPQNKATDRYIVRRRRQK